MDGSLELPLLTQTITSCLGVLQASHENPEKHSQFQSLMKKLCVLQKKGEVRDLSDDYDTKFYELLLTLLPEGI